jgi:hypothetical protein
MKALHIKRVTWAELHQQWGSAAEVLSSDAVHMPGMGLGNHYVYVRCKASGEINWDKTAVYKLEELIQRDNVRIVR